eukprot:5879907-Amphidinium_carterae.1
MDWRDVDVVASLGRRRSTGESWFQCWSRASTCSATSPEIGQWNGRTLSCTRRQEQTRRIGTLEVMIVFVVSTDPTRTHAGLLNPSDELGIPREVLPPWRMDLIPDDERKTREDNWRGVFFEKGPQGKVFWENYEKWLWARCSPTTFPKSWTFPTPHPAIAWSCYRMGRFQGGPRGLLGDDNSAGMAAWPRPGWQCLDSWKRGATVWQPQLEHQRRMPWIGGTLPQAGGQRT